jgi:cobalt/nickel transport protein
MAGVISNFASKEPDGLERVAGELGFEGEKISMGSPFPDYRVPEIENELLAGSLARVGGIFIVLTLILLLGIILRR